MGDFNRNGHCDILWHHRTLGTVGAWLLLSTAYSSYIPIGVAL